MTQVCAVFACRGKAAFSSFKHHACVVLHTSHNKKTHVSASTDSYRHSNVHGIRQAYSIKLPALQFIRCEGITAQEPSVNAKHSSTTPNPPANHTTHSATNLQEATKLPIVAAKLPAVTKQLVGNSLG